LDFNKRRCQATALLLFTGIGTTSGKNLAVRKFQKKARFRKFDLGVQIVNNVLITANLSEISNKKYRFGKLSK
jgi:uncharacterized membrane protein YsdA (DUF1294 family)